MKTALITGVRGQDGAYLSQLLLAKGYQVYGADRAGAAGLWRLQELGISGRVKQFDFDITSQQSVERLLCFICPDEIYNFAAQSSVSTSFEKPVLTAEINAVGAVRLLDAARRLIPHARFMQASSSEMFGAAGRARSESGPFAPANPYAASKLYAHNMVGACRQTYGMHASSSILFNHESPLRGEEFLTRKITMAAARIKKGLQKKVEVGNLNAARDWGYAPEYVEAMWLMLQQPKGGDYIIASGKTHTVREFISSAFAAAGLKLAWKGKGLREKGVNSVTGKTLVEVLPDFYRPQDSAVMACAAAKAKKALGWHPVTRFNEIVELMVQADMKRLEVNK